MDDSREGFVYGGKSLIGPVTLWSPIKKEYGKSISPLVGEISAAMYGMFRGVVSN